ncbi:hypothetical protein IQ07DRAFT_507072 [Pyrenochaeta sp. DS3sAY3a]|nr:hypothetical protein IQ07DRAFT_507072 [Pyrenochaeta sp. DS3sAY3a]
MATQPLSYVHLDGTDRQFFDHALANDIERYAFFRFFQSVESKWTKQMRPRTGNGRIKAWNKSSKHYWLQLARNTQPLPTVLRPTWTPPAPPAQAAPAAPALPPPVAPAPQPSTTTAPALSIDITTVETVPAPPVPPTLSLIIPIPSGISQTTPISPVVGIASALADAVNHIAHVSTKRPREDQSGDEENERPAKRHLPAMGGERCPQFVYHNDPHSETKVHFLHPARQQRLAIQERLGGNWRFAKTFQQPLLSDYSMGSKVGIAPVSSFLFVKLNEDGVIEDRLALKCRDISQIDILRALADTEHANLRSTTSTDCKHVHRQRENFEEAHEFKIRGNPGQVKWTLNYISTEYAPHCTLEHLIKEHENQQKIISEHFCWFVFQSIVDALITFKTGYCTEVMGNDLNEDSRRPGWLSMLHLDIKPSNIFLAGPSTKYDFYKQPILADYDSSISLSENMEQRERDLAARRFAGTTYWQAPEQCHRYEGLEDVYPPIQWPLVDAVDVYSLGLVIRYMMMCSRTRSFVRDLHDEEANIFLEEGMKSPSQVEYDYDRTNYPPTYSTALIEAVHSCLAFRQRMDPAQPNKRYRPTLFQLRDIINVQLSRLEAQGTEKFSTAQVDPTSVRHILFPQEDPRYALGAIFVPPHNVPLEKLTLSDASTAEEQEARDCWQAHAKEAQDGTPNQHAGLDKSAMDQVLSCAYNAASVEIMTDGGSDQRKSALECGIKHAVNTIRKCANPESTFDQVKGVLDPEFLSPRIRFDVLTYLKAGAEENRRRNGEKRPHEQTVLVYERQQLAISQSDWEREEEVLKRFTEAGVSGIDMQRQEAKHDISNIDNNAAAYTALIDALDLGLALLVMGRELDLDPEMADEQPHWIKEISSLHQGVWEYFWTWPDGVPRAD